MHPPPHTSYIVPLRGTEAVGYEAWCSCPARAVGIPLLGDILIGRVTAQLFTCPDNVTQPLVSVTLRKLLPGVMGNGRK